MGGHAFVHRGFARGRRSVGAGRRTFVATIAALCLTLLAASVHGQGFSVPDQGARAAALGEAFAAQADDASAIYYNPAGLIQIDGTEFMAGLYAINFDTTFDGVDDDDRHHQTYVVPHAYLSIDPGDPDVRFGLGVNNTYGLGVEWSADGPLRSVVTEAELLVTTVSPTLALRVSDGLSVGGSVNIYASDLERRSIVPSVHGPEFALSIDGRGVAVGFTLGALWEPASGHKVAAVYRAPFAVDFNGRAQIKAPGGPPVADGRARFSIEFPQSITLGYSYTPVPGCTLEFDLVWTDWTGFDAIELQSMDPLIDSIPPEAFEYGTSLSPRLGAELQFDEHWTGRVGYGYFEDVSPSATFSPLVPDFDAHLFSAGFGYDAGSWRVDFAYQFIARNGRVIEDSVNSPPGRYSDHTHGIMTSFTIRF
jgi:long-chain fatty acid transport protein